MFKKVAVTGLTATVTAGLVSYYLSNEDKDFRVSLLLLL